MGYLVLLLLASGCLPEASARCNKRLIIYTLRYQNCMRLRLLTYACAGTCTSSTQWSEHGLIHFCECCREQHSEVRRLVLRCPRGDHMTRAVVPIRMPVSCSCRPCSYTPDHVIPAEDELRKWLFLYSGYQLIPTMLLFIKQLQYLFLTLL